MPSRHGTYCAFYVAEPFNQNSLGAHAAKDFCYYNLLRSWKGNDSTFPFADSHDATYNVRDASDWENTLKPRLRQRLRYSKHILLFLSSGTLNSRAVREEVDYGINYQGLPVIVVYPEFDSKESLLRNGSLSHGVMSLWNNIPIFRDSMEKVPTIHVPMKKELIRSALADPDFQIQTKTRASIFRYIP